MIDDADFGGALPDFTELTVADLAKLDRDALAQEIRSLHSCVTSTRVRASFSAFIGLPAEDAR